MSLAASDDRASLASTQRLRSWVIADGGLRALAGGFEDLARHAVDGELEDRLVEVDAAEALDPRRLDHVLERRTLPPQQGDVERPAAEVVDEHRRVRGQGGDGGVVDRRRRGLGDQVGLTESDVTEGVAQRAELVLGPVRRMGDDDAVGGAADLLGHRGGRPLGHQRGQPVGVVRRARQHQRNRIADTPLELPGESLWLRRAAALGRPTEQQLVAGGEDDGRDRDRVGGQRDDFDDAVAADGRGGERGPHVDPEVIRHASLLPSGAAS